MIDFIFTTAIYVIKKITTECLGYSTFCYHCIKFEGMASKQFVENSVEFKIYFDHSSISDPEKLL